MGRRDRVPAHTPQKEATPFEEWFEAPFAVGRILNNT